MRPEGFKANVIAHNKLASMGIVFPYEEDLRQSIELVEAGADALLEGLKKKGVRITKATRMVTQPIFEEGDGYLVFIPEEKE